MKSKKLPKKQEPKSLEFPELFNDFRFTDLDYNVVSGAHKVTFTKVLSLDGTDYIYYVTRINEYLNKNEKVNFTYLYNTQFATKQIELKDLKILHTFLKGQIIFIVATCKVSEEICEYIREQFKVVIPSVFSIEKDKSKEEK
jgi:hypothetical protein